MEFVEELKLLDSIRSRLKAHQPGRNLDEALQAAKRVRELLNVKRGPPSADRQAAIAYAEVLGLSDAIEGHDLDRVKGHLDNAMTALRAVPDRN